MDSCVRFPVSSYQSCRNCPSLVTAAAAAAAGLRHDGCDIIVGFSSPEYEHL